VEFFPEIFGCNIQKGPCLQFLKILIAWSRRGKGLECVEDMKEVEDVEDMKDVENVKDVGYGGSKDMLLRTHGGQGQEGVEDIPITTALQPPTNP
jgi:hypothetical protein